MPKMNAAIAEHDPIEARIRLYGVSMEKLHTFCPCPGYPDTCIVAGPLVNLPYSVIGGSYEDSERAARAYVREMAEAQIERSGDPAEMAA